MSRQDSRQRAHVTAAIMKVVDAMGLLDIIEEERALHARHIQRGITVAAPFGVSDGKGNTVPCAVCRDEHDRYCCTPNCDRYEERP